MPGSRFRQGTNDRNRRTLQQLARERLGAKPDEQVANDSPTRREHICPTDQRQKRRSGAEGPHTSLAPTSISSRSNEKSGSVGTKLPNQSEGSGDFGRNSKNPSVTASRSVSRPSRCDLPRVKAKLDGKTWKYRLVPRASPAKEKK